MSDEIKNENNSSSTSDLNLASFILASGYKEYSFHKGIDSRGKVRTIFDFNIPEETFMELKKNYANGSGMISALEMVNAQRHFKNICFM